MDRMGRIETPIEFWGTRRVLEIVGLSKSELYRLMAEGDFPKPRKYRGKEKNFWPSSEVVAWQRAQIGDDEFEALLAL